MTEIRKRHLSDARILEIGGASDPVVRGLPYQSFCSDTDIHALQVAQLAEADGESPIQFVAAAIDSLPFSEKSFECIIARKAATGANGLEKPAEKLQRLLAADGFIVTEQDQGYTIMEASGIVSIDSDPKCRPVAA